MTSSLGDFEVLPFERQSVRALDKGLNAAFLRVHRYVESTLIRHSEHVLVAGTLIEFTSGNSKSQNEFLHIGPSMPLFW